MKNAVGDGIKSCCYKAASGLGETKCSQAGRQWVEALDVEEWAGTMNMDDKSCPRKG